MYVKDQHGCQKTTCWSLFPYSTMWVLGIELMFSDMVVSALTTELSPSPTVHIFNYFRIYFIVYNRISKELAYVLVSMLFSHTIVYPFA